MAQLSNDCFAGASALLPLDQALAQAKCVDVVRRRDRRTRQNALPGQRAIIARPLGEPSPMNRERLRSQNDAVARDVVVVGRQPDLAHLRSERPEHLRCGIERRQLLWARHWRLGVEMPGKPDA